MFYLELEVRMGGAGSPFANVELLLQKTQAAATACNPSQAHLWEDGRQRGACIVNKTQ